jgi:hypothetical protein
MNKNLSFSIRGPDRISEELATVLSTKGSWEFKSLFDIVHANLRFKGFANGGEEMLRLRSHEKLQKFLSAGIVTKTGKEYTGVPKALVNYFEMAAELKAKVEAAIRNRAALQSVHSASTPTAIAKVTRRKRKA